MKLVSVNVGLPRKVVWKGRTVTTGIFKEAIEGSVSLRKLNLDGDRQADLSVHGGADKAVYVYPSEHYAYWRRAAPHGASDGDVWRELHDLRHDRRRDQHRRSVSNRLGVGGGYAAANALLPWSWRNYFLKQLSR